MSDPDLVNKGEGTKGKSYEEITITRLLERATDLYLVHTGYLPLYYGGCSNLPFPI